MDLRKALTFFPSEPADRSRNDAAAEVALIMAHWLDDEETFRAVQVGDMRGTDALEAYVRERAEEALSTTNGRNQIIMPVLGGHDLDMDFARIRDGRQAEHYASENRARLVRERSNLLIRVRQIEALLR